MNNITITDFLSRFENVRQTGETQFVCSCSAHNDKSPSLGVKELDDRILINCFSGCSPHEIVSAVGLSLSDLFRKSENYKPVRNPFPAKDILQCLSSEALIVMMASCDLMNGGRLSPEDHARLVTATSRIYNAAAQAGWR